MGRYGHQAVISVSKSMSRAGRKGEQDGKRRSESSETQCSRLRLLHRHAAETEYLLWVDSFSRAR